MNRSYRTRGVRIAIIVGVVLLLGAVWVQGSNVGTTFATGSGTGGLEMKIDNKTFYNGVLQPKLSWQLKNLEPWHDFFFDFDDVKPGDSGTTTISIHIKKNPAYVCLDFKNFKEEENGINEPESHADDDQTGELGEELEFFSWYDDGDNKFEVGEKPIFGTSTQSAVQVLKNKSYAIADSVTGSPILPYQTKYIGIAWCAGNLTVDVPTAKITCDHSSMGNEAQTDSMTLDVALRAVASSQQPKFTCNKPETPPEPVRKCDIEGHKYDHNTQPLKGWTIGLMKVVKHNKGTDVYDLATAVTDKDGYFCLKWNGTSQTARGKTTYKGGPSSYTYRVFEKLQSGWENVDVERGPDYNSLVQVPKNDILMQGEYVSVQVGEQNGTIVKNAAYHVDFYNYNQRGGGGWHHGGRGNAWTSFKDYCGEVWSKVRNKRA